MDNTVKDKDLGAVSILLRLGASCLFFVTARNQMEYGYYAISSKMKSMFQGLLPYSTIDFAAKTICLTQIILALWILSGIRLRAAWFCSGIFMVSLCFGLLILKQYNHVYGNYIYLLFICAGLAVSKHDRLQF